MIAIGMIVTLPYRTPCVVFANYGAHVGLERLTYPVDSPRRCSAAEALIDTSWRVPPNEDQNPEAHDRYVGLAMAVRAYREGSIDGD